MAFRIELYQHFFVFALSTKEDLIAIGILPAGKIEAVGALKHFADIQSIRPGGNYFKAYDASHGIEYELGALTKVRSIG
jgi:hypothetical protein